MADCLVSVELHMHKNNPGLKTNYFLKLGYAGGFYD